MDARVEGQYYRAIPVIEPSAVQPNLVADIKVLLDALMGRWRLIALSIGVALALGIAYVWITPPTYRATSEILLDPRERRLVDNDVVPGGLGSSYQGADASLVESQVEILRSRSVLTALIKRENLEADPDFGGNASQGTELTSILKTLLYGPNSESYEGMSTFDRAMTALLQETHVERVGNTYVLRINVAAPSPDKAARIANGLAELYLDEGRVATKTASQEAAVALEARLAQLQTQSDESQRAVEQYRADNGLLGAEGLLIDEQQLRDLNDQVTKASAATQAAKAKLDEARRLAALPLSTSAGSNSLSSDLGNELRAQLDIARGEESGLATIYGARHPSLILATGKRQALERGLTEEIGRIVNRIGSEYHEAAQTESSLRDLLTQSEMRRATANNASIMLRQLERQAQSDQQLLETFSVRASQIREQIDLPTNNARVISPAIANSQPSEPRPALVLPMALVGGAAVGVSAAWLLHLVGGRPQQSRQKKQKQHKQLRFRPPVFMARPKDRRPEGETPTRAATRVRTVPTSAKSNETRRAHDEILGALASGESGKPAEAGGRRRLITGLFK